MGHRIPPASVLVGNVVITRQLLETPDRRLGVVPDRGVDSPSVRSLTVDIGRAHLAHDAPILEVARDLTADDDSPGVRCADIRVWNLRMTVPLGDQAINRVPESFFNIIPTVEMVTPSGPNRMRFG